MPHDSISPITVWGQGGPNPPKVTIVLEEIGLPYKVIAIAFEDIKKPDYFAVNPNGRVPAIHDPNTDITLWESGAIVEYLVERYDYSRKISFPPVTSQYFLAKQWLFFQTTGQGPYFGQLVWFIKFASEEISIAIQRYRDEIDRVTNVLEIWLARQKEIYGKESGPWLVGNRISYADLAFVPWYFVLPQAAGQQYLNLTKYPLVAKWLARMHSRPAVEKSLSQGTFR